MQRFVLLAILIWFSTAICIDSKANAANLEIRSSQKSGYTRLVFDWGNKSDYTLKRPIKDQLDLRFQRKGSVSLSEIQATLPANLIGIALNSSPNKNVVLQLNIPKQSRVRDFSIGTRIILDIYDPPGGPVIQALPPEKNIRESDQKNITTAQTKPVTPIENTSKNVTGNITENDQYRVEDGKQAKPVQVEEKNLTQNNTPTKGTLKDSMPMPPGAYSITGNNTITLTSTEALYLSAFTRAGTLWIIHNQPNSTVPPKISGPDSTKFPDIEALALDDQYGAYRMRLPLNGQAYTEGGGLLWRINITQNAPEKPYSKPDIIYKGEHKNIASLVWDMPSAHFLMEFTDPEIGDRLNVVGVGRASELSGKPRTFVDLMTLNSLAGLVFAPKVDDLRVSLQNRGVSVARNGGLKIAKGRGVQNVFSKKKSQAPLRTISDKPGKQNQEQNPGQPENTEEEDPRLRRIYDFERWILGGPLKIRDNENLLVATAASSDKVGRAEALLSLGKLYIANNRGPEALGYLNYAVSVSSDLKQSPEFLALKGAAEILTGQFQDAYQSYLSADLDKYEEMDMWRALVLAGLGDWGQAGEVLPKDISIVHSYPEPLRQEVALTLAEVALRDGRQDQADKLLKIAKNIDGKLTRFQKAALDYLGGEANRQRGEYEAAITLWTPLAEWKPPARSLDDLHRVKAGVALAKLLYQEKRINAEEAIDRLEQLRYGWRGDTLETSIYQSLGNFYLENNNYLKGLAVLRKGTELSTTPTLSKEIATNMSQAFENLFLTDEIEKLSPLEAVSVYEKFQELTPAGERGDNVIRSLAERLVEVGLLSRASGLMAYLVDKRMDGLDAIKISLRLAAIEILDDKPENALQTLQNTQNRLSDLALTNIASTQGTIEIKEFERDIALLKARAYSDKGSASRAIATLSQIPNQDKDVLRLRADIAWQNGDWNEASRSLERLIGREGLGPQQPLSEDQAGLILNWAVALNLVNDRQALASLRLRFGQSMGRTTRARLFDVVTRERQNVGLADRETIQAIVNEIDLFSDFLSSYRNRNS